MERKTLIPVALSGFLIASLLVGARFGFPWAGGAGEAEKPLSLVVSRIEGEATADAAGRSRALVVGDTLVRGEVLATSDDTRLELTADGVRFGMDERTLVELTSLIPSDLAVTVRTGRVAATISADTAGFGIVTKESESRISTAGTLAITYYNFEDRVDIAPVEGPVAVFLSDGRTFISASAQEVTEAPSLSIRAIPFDPSAGAGAAFFAWYGLTR
ncbi:hypothetical protein A2856_01845 [Candidatus Uhrbacteria bacterium RIFCSPHIGHO2_01_FULL_63_20]|uniref:FecR protein domain-containing protein n=1 Tax=Candidatus Uhrbacteria bacterium RIFCSPHIGHO2_01_FULL_63_20 TaxID=1802385 RepID=A0A1F7TLI3_9BACT|nr:MAG: hypothetical protein A2856_01845 [Candidatus Uhrbacteria bacterium RIFCSPHIGHO2_01_FULL_63_20]